MILFFLDGCWCFFFSCFFKKIGCNNSVPYPIKLEPSVVCVEIKGTYRIYKVMKPIA